MSIPLAEGHSVLGDGNNQFTSVNTESLDPVDVTRLQGTNFLFERYSYIDIQSPDAFTPAPPDSKTVSR